MRAGVIDIGSDSIKLLIGETTPDKETFVLESLRNVLTIGKSTFLSGRISQEAIIRTIDILEKYKKILKDYEVANLRAVATTAIREASNRDIFIDTIFRKTGIKVEVLNVGDVVYYIDAFLSHRLEKKYPIHEKNLIIAELGGGSLDISVMRKGFTLMNLGFSIGTLRLRQLLGNLDGSSEENIEAVKEYVDTEFNYLKGMMPRIQIDDVILIDENYFYFQNILPDKKVTSKFFQFTQKESEQILSQIYNRKIKEIAQAYNIPFEITESIPGYAIILNKLFNLTQNKYIYILETSLTDAILENILFNLELSEKYDKENQLISTAKSLCYKYNADVSHAKQVAFISESLFHQLAKPLGLQKNDKLYLVLASYLHDIGEFIHNRSHHKHSEYIISMSNLFRLSDEEMKVIACIARYHRKAYPSKSHLLFSSLSSEHQLLVQKLSALLRIANSLDTSHKQKIKKIDVQFNSPQALTLLVEIKGNFLLEKFDFQNKKNLFEEITGNKISLIIKE